MKISQKLKIMLKSMLSIQFGSVVTDKAELIWDGEEDLREGFEVFVRGEEDEFVPAPDGDYTTEDGKIIKVVEGKVSEIVDNNAEVEETAEQTEEIAQEEVKQTEEIQQEENPEADPVEEPENEDDRTEEDRIAALETRVAEFLEGLNKIVNSIAAIEDRLGVVEEKLAKVEEPAAEPVDEQPEVKQSKSILGYLRK